MYRPTRSCTCIAPREKLRRHPDYYIHIYTAGHVPRYMYIDSTCGGGGGGVVIHVPVRVQPSEATEKPSVNKSTKRGQYSSTT